MCGRYALYSEKDEITEHFGAESKDDGIFVPRYNIAPGSINPVVLVGKSRDTGIGALKWGLVPSWSKDEKIGYSLINARSETLNEKPSFKNSFERRRCVIPANGFYEWKKFTEKKKIPFYIRLLKQHLFGFAGLFDSWETPDGDKLFTYTIITTEANALLQPLHERMPVILRPEQYAIWLDPINSNTETMQNLLTPYPTDEMSVFQVSDIVNNARNDGPELIQPVM